MNASIPAAIVVGFNLGLLFATITTVISKGTFGGFGGLFGITLQLLAVTASIFNLYRVTK